MEMALFNIFDLPMVLAIFLGLLLASVLLFAAGRRHLLLAAYLYCITLVELDKVIFWSMPIHRLFEPAVPIIFALGKCVGLLVFPLLYFYMQALNTTAKPAIKSAIYLSLILMFGVILSLLLYHSLGSSPERYLPSLFHDIFFDRYYVMLLIGKYGLFVAFAAFYISSSFPMSVHNKKNAVGKNESAGHLSIVIWGALLIYSLEFFTDFLAALKMDSGLLNALGVLHNYSVLLYLCLILVYLLGQHFLRKSRKISVSGIGVQKLLHNDVDKIHQIMLEQKYYLDSNITLEGLAKKLKLPEYQLSILLNKNFQKNFFDFINHYRMEHAKELMVSELGKGHSILKILYDSGFNSKSAFNRCFKKYTGITPSEYRERYKAVSQ